MPTFFRIWGMVGNRKASSNSGQRNFWSMNSRHGVPTQGNGPLSEIIRLLHLV